jgi:hypothetical protein
MIVKYFKRRLFKFIKQSKIVFLLYERITCRKELRAARKSYDGMQPKSADVIRREKQAHHNYWHCGDFVYERYGLAYKDLSIDEILDYAPTYFHHKKLEKDHSGIDTIRYSDKLVQARMFADLDIPCATSLAYFDGKVWKSVVTDSDIDVISVIDDYFMREGGKIFIKPIDGQGGNGIFVLKKQNNLYYLNDKQILLSLIASELGDNRYLMQSGIIQSAQIMSINPTSVNTLRVIVQREELRMTMKSCSMRIGRSGMDLDNSCQGGICIKVDINTGQLDLLAKSRFDGYTFERHPDSGVQFKDIRIHNWEAVKKMIEDEASKLVSFNNIALDVAVTNNGIQLIEFNFRYGIEHQQCVLGGVRQILGIPNK